jgi:predicted ester cyclase
MDPSENKALVRRHLEEAVSGARSELWDEIMAEDFHLHHPSLKPGRANYMASVDVLRAGFPDLREEILDLVAEGDRVVARYIERGTHLGDFMGVPPTGKAYEKHGFALYRIADGRLAEAWVQEDELGFERQLFV